MQKGTRWEKILLAGALSMLIAACGSLSVGTIGDNSEGSAVTEGNSEGSSDGSEASSSDDGNNGTSETDSTTAGDLPSITSAVSKAIPFISGSLTTNIAAGSISKKYLSEDVAKWSVEQFFKAECHDDNNILNICPEGAELTLDNKFSLCTLIGLVYHSEMKMGDIYRYDNSSYMTCERGDSAAELIDHTPVFHAPDSDKYVIDFGDLFDCVGQFNSYDEDYPDQTTYILYSKSEDGRIFASLNSRKQHESEHWYTGIMSDIFQTYVSRDEDGKIQILGFNEVGFDEKGEDDYADRSVLLANVQEHKFAVKNSHIVALGMGGYDFETGQWTEGYYMARVTDGAEGFNFCIQNGDTSMIVDSSNCVDIAGFFSEAGWTAERLYNWLDIGPEDQLNLAGFDKFFSDSSAVPLSEVPQNGVDYFPDSISN